MNLYFYINKYLRIHHNCSYVHFCIVTVELFEIELKCPNFMEKENIVTCRINKTAFGCTSPTEFVMLDRTVNGNTETICYTNNPVCEKQNNSNIMCWCEESSQGIFTYVFRYLATRSKDLGALLECQYCPESKPNLIETVIGNCKNITFG